MCFAFYSEGEYGLQILMLCWMQRLSHPFDTCLSPKKLQGSWSSKTRAVSCVGSCFFSGEPHALSAFDWGAQFWAQLPTITRLIDGARKTLYSATGWWPCSLQKPWRMLGMQRRGEGNCREGECSSRMSTCSLMTRTLQTILSLVCCSICTQWR